MGSSQSIQPRPDSDSDSNSNSEYDDEEQEDETNRRLLTSPTINPSSKVVEQEPEILPCHQSASPLSAVCTPRSNGGGPHIKVWDPCHVLLPPPSRSFHDVSNNDATTEIYLISHGESAASLRPDLVTGRWAKAGLTGNGERQARAMAVFLKSNRVHFQKVFCSPLDRALMTAALVCRELGFETDQIETSNDLTEMSQGQWEGFLYSETYTPEILALAEKSLSDFAPPSGESLRQVQFRVIEFLHKTVLKPPEKLIPSNSTPNYSRQNSTNSIQENPNPNWDLVYRLNRPGLQRKKSGKSRLQFVTKGDNETEDDLSPREKHDNGRGTSPCIGIFTHSTPIRCAIAGILGVGSDVSQRFCIDDSSVTIVQHSWRSGWQVKRLNDTSHLRLL